MQKNILFLFYLLFMSTTSYALPFTIQPKAQLPTAVHAGSTTSAYYTVVNNTGSQRNNNYIKYLPPNVTQVTTGGTYADTCGAAFNLAASGHAGSSCTLQLTVFGAVNGSDPNPHNHLFVCLPGGTTCAGTYYPLNVTQLPPLQLTAIVVSPESVSIGAGTTQQFFALGVYDDNSTQNITSLVTWNSSNPATATISPTGLAIGLATGSTLISAVYASMTSNAVVMTIMGYAYAANSANGTISYCAIHSDGSFGNCSLTTGGVSFSHLQGIAVANKTLYVVDQDYVYYCPINSDGSVGICLATGSGLSDIRYIAVNQTGTTAYVSNNTTVSYCQINPFGSLGNCKTAGNFNDVEVVALHPIGAFAYVVNSISNTVSYCPINPNGSFADCHTTGSGFNHPQGMTVNKTGTYAYVVNQGDNTISYCSINTNGSFESCLTAKSGLTNSSGIVVHPAGGQAYIANPAENTVSVCTINADGSFGDCHTTGNGFQNPIGISVL